ncbi:MAG TPA: hypothetical protein VMX97_14950 [Hyphomicrobiaceae bacterium]|nr:hypothetical protein [Hyphomicrobiaceae bacterium]
MKRAVAALLLASLATPAAAGEHDKTKDLCSLVAMKPYELSKLSDDKLHGLHCRLGLVVKDVNERIEALESREREDPALRDKVNELIGVHNICLIASGDAFREMLDRKLHDLIDPAKCKSN